MRSYERSGVTVDQCTECRGIFLDRGELERLVDADTRFHGGGRAAAAPPPPQQPQQPPTSSRRTSSRAATSSRAGIRPAAVQEEEEVVLLRGALRLSVPGCRRAGDAVDLDTGLPDPGCCAP